MLLAGILFLAVGAVMFYTRRYKYWDYMKKFVFKTVLIYLLLGGTAFMAMIFVVTVKEVAEEETFDMKGSRLSRAENYARQGNYNWLANSLVWEEDYEEEFSYLWEQLTMYKACNRYLVFAAAEEAGMGEAYREQADSYRALLEEMCTAPAYEENIPYGTYFSEKAGFTSGKVKN